LLFELIPITMQNDTKVISIITNQFNKHLEWDKKKSYALGTK